MHSKREGGDGEGRGSTPYCTRRPSMPSRRVVHPFHQRTRGCVLRQLLHNGFTYKFYKINMQLMQCCIRVRVEPRAL